MGREVQFLFPKRNGVTGMIFMEFLFVRMKGVITCLAFRNMFEQTGIIWVNGMEKSRVWENNSNAKRTESLTQ